jgi:hypothetical protein
MFHRMDDQAFIQVATAAVLGERAKRRQQKHRALLGLVTVAWNIKRMGVTCRDE